MEKILDALICKNTESVGNVQAERENLLQPTLNYPQMKPQMVQTISEHQNRKIKVSHFEAKFNTNDLKPK